MERDSHLLTVTGLQEVELSFHSRSNTLQNLSSPLKPEGKLPMSASG